MSEVDKVLKETKRMDLGDTITLIAGVSAGYIVDGGFGVRERISEKIQNTGILQLEPDEADFFGWAVAMLVYLAILGYSFKGSGLMKYGLMGFSIGGMAAEIL